MPSPVLFFACLLAICLPIMAVQLPRFPFFARLRSKMYAETRHGQPRDESSTSSKQQDDSQLLRRRTRYQTTDGTFSSEEDSQIPSPLTGTSMKKPWDPPFPRMAQVMGKGKPVEWRSLPPTPPRKTGRELEARGVAVRLFPQDSDGDGTHATLAKPETSSVHEDQTTTKETEFPYPERAEPVPSNRTQQKSRSSVMSVVWPALAILAILLFVLSFAILIAHCLAWFLVYKTEARLGEARRGIVQGGEMRLCLCAT